jgi:transposase
MNTDDIITKVILFVKNGTKALDNVKVHAIKSMLKKVYDIDVSYKLIEKRFNDIH